MRTHFRHVVLYAILAPAWAAAFTPINLATGWNLMGNSDPGSINVANTLGVSGVTTV
ncbi:MAG: hypothetical protein PHH58_10660 [Rhodoferax sp.]|nr:hypothetical protein [Rhodoferax sp.]